MADPFAHVIQMLIEERRNRGWTQRHTAELAGIAQTDLCHYERGRIRPGFERLAKWASAFGFDVQVVLIARHRL